jgi:hypothetical protein
MPYQDGPAIAAAYSFEITKRGTTAARTFTFQSHEYKPGDVETKDLKIGSSTVRQPMQTGVGEHDCEFLIPTEEVADYRSFLRPNAIIDAAVMPDWNEAAGPHFVKSVTITDKIDGESVLKCTISESNGGVAAA